MLNAGDSDAAEYLLNKNSRPLLTGHMAALYFSASFVVRMWPCGQVVEWCVSRSDVCPSWILLKEGVPPPTPLPPHPPQGMGEPQDRKGLGP